MNDGIRRAGLLAPLLNPVVAVNHEFGGDYLDLADVSRNGALRDAQPGRILESTARTKVDRYDHATGPDMPLSSRLSALRQSSPPVGTSTGSFMQHF